MTSLRAPTADDLEHVRCYLCGADTHDPFIEAEDDLSGKPGTFRFVRCRRCGLTYQNPRVRAERIGDYYDDDYVSHRTRSWGPLEPLVTRALDVHDRRKLAICRRYVDLGPASTILDVGSGSGAFLAHAKKETGARVVGVDFKPLSHLPFYAEAEFFCGPFAQQDLGDLAQDALDVITLWHFLEHDYDPLASLAKAREAIKPGGRIVIEVPQLDSVTFKLFQERWPGLQAPQHTLLLNRTSLLRFVAQAGLEVVDYQTSGAFPPYFYVFCGAAFKLLRGRGLDLNRVVLPYFLGQLALGPWISLAERVTPLAMQTVVCRK